MGDTKQQFNQAEAELAEERLRVEQAQQECAELAMGRQKAEECVMEAERTKDDLEQRLAAMMKDLSTPGNNMAGLVQALSEEQEHTAELQKTNDGLDATWRLLEAQLHEVSASKGVVESDLSKAQIELISTRDEAMEAAKQAEQARAALEEKMEKMEKDSKEKEAMYLLQS